MKWLWKSETVATGLAIFSMFFGAGNVVFPLVIGRYAGDKNIYAVLGFLATAVCVPFIGLVSMVLFNGDYKKFFGRLGKLPGMLTVFAVMLVIGPFGAIPRCIALSYSTVKSFLPATTLFIFCLIASIIIYLFAMRKSKVVGLLGRVLSPVLLVSLVVIIVKGFISGSAAEILQGRRSLFLLEGLVEGYNTMDIFAAFFFSGVVIAGLKQRLTKNHHDASPNSLLRNTLYAGMIGLSLLGIIYTGFSYVSAFYGEQLGGIAPDALISQIAYFTLGSYAGIIACIAVSLACLTTAVALSVVFADFLQTQVLQTQVFTTRAFGKIGNRMGYKSCLLLTTVITFAVSNLGFTVIVKLIAPILVILYPPLIVLAFINIAHKLWGLKMVKLPVYATFVGVVLYRLLTTW